ncbi:MAG: hypothetical protein DMG04_19060 [Acidobacteria bacterium]|nr:MAG: hypothetical protein DMG04_19060 [Acidobacteriota bacterium]PYQ90316.1 MAG: hypothetical protein DMG02_10450 [Acidobacteriota bacterium]
MIDARLKASRYPIDARLKASRYLIDARLKASRYPDRRSAESLALRDAVAATCRSASLSGERTPYAIVSAVS